MTKQLFTRTTKALGKLLAAMVPSPHSRKPLEATWKDYPRFPAY